MFHLIQGDDEYRIAVKRDELQAIFLRDGEASVDRYSGQDSECNLTQVYNSVSTLSFFQSRKIVIVEDAVSLLDREKNFLAKTSGLNLLRDIIRSSDDVLVIFTAFKDTVAKNTRVFKLMEENGKVTDIKKFWHDPNQGFTGDLIRWFMAEIKKRNLNLNRKQIMIISNRVGADLRQLSNELDKITLYLDGQDASELDDKALNDLIPPSRELVIFNLIDAVAEKHRQRAIAYLKDLIAGGENESSIITRLHRNFRQILFWIALQDDEVKIDERVKLLELKSDFVRRKIMEQSKKFSSEDMPRIISALAFADEEIKTTTYSHLRSNQKNSLIMEKLIVKLTG